MKLNINPGKYVVAVSGGVDSVVLLDKLNHQKDLSLIIAHFDHGIRPNSQQDRAFVQELAKKYYLPFEYAEGGLGLNTSEARAREARYRFLNMVKKKHDASAIITAHHQDDVLETIIINILRGTGRKGLSSLQSNQDIVRPLIPYSKVEIIDYAQKNNLSWRDDETNKDTAYLRNWVRLAVVPKLSSVQRNNLLHINADAIEKNKIIDTLLNKFIDSKSPQVLSKKYLLSLPHNMALELVAQWLRLNKVQNFDKKMIERIVINSKILAADKTLIVNQGSKILNQKRKITLIKINS